MITTNVNLQKVVSCRVTNSVLRYLESTGYSVDPIIDDLPYSKEYLYDPLNWVSYETRETICRRAVNLTNNTALMYNVGLSIPKLNPLGGIESMVRMLFGPKTAYRYVPKYASLFDKVFKFNTIFNGNNQATVTMNMDGEYSPSKDSCYYTQGILAAIPTVWGLPLAEVHEKKCMCKADIHTAKEDVQYEAEACVYEVQWQKLKLWHRRLLDNYSIRGHHLRSNIKDLENNFRLLDHKNAELVERNKQLAIVREIAIRIDDVKTIDEALGLVVEQAREIAGVLFVLVQKLDESKEFVITPYYSKIRSQYKYMVDALKVLGFDPDKELGNHPTSKKLRLPFSKLKVAQDIVNNPRMMIFTSLADMLDGVWPRMLCNSIQKIMGVKKLVMLPLIIEGEYWGSILYFLSQEVPTDILEMIAGHCALSVKNISNTESLANEAIRRRILIEQSRDGIVILDEKGKVYEVNRRFAEMLGYSMEEVLELSVWDWEYLIPRERLVEMIRIVDESGDHFETKHRRKDGSFFDVEISTNGAIFAGQKLIFCVCRDITDRKKAEAVLKKQKELIDRILSTSPSAVLVIDGNSNINLANETFCNIFKKNMDEVVGNSISQILPVEDLLQELSKALTQKDYHSKCEFKYKVNNQEIVLSANILQMQVGEVQLIINDISKERENQERLYLTDRLASIGEMASGVAHELNNPLTGIIGLAEFLLGQEMPDETKEDIKAISSEAQRSAKIVKNLLTFARKHEPTKKPVQINNIVKDVLNLRAYEHKANNITVVTHLDNGIPEVMTDQFQMQQVFLNIILNAEQSMIETHKHGTLNISSERIDNYVKLSFSDDGPGISPENLRKLFSPFFTTKEVGKGTGLGLSICYGIVTNHNGKIYARSEHGNGATFAVELPIDNL